MVPPVGEDVVLDVLVQTLLHAVKVLRVVRLPTLHGAEGSPLAGLLQQISTLCLYETRRFRYSSLGHIKFN